MDEQRKHESEVPNGIPSPKKQTQKTWPAPTVGAINLSHYQPPSIPFDLEKLEYISDDDPSVVFLAYESDANIHAACGLVGSPVAQQATPAATAALLRAWVQRQFLAAAPNCTVMEGPGVPSTSVFQRLSYIEFGNLVNGGVSFFPWATSMLAAGASLGKLYVATRGGDGEGSGPQGQYFRGWEPFMA